MRKRWLVGAAGAALVLFGASERAGAEMSGGCSGSGTWREGGFSVDASVSGVVEVPRSDTVEWRGSRGAAPGEYEGSIWAELPPPLGRVTIDSWEGDSQKQSSSGVEEYDIPSVVPGGIEFSVAGEHTDEAGTCTGSVRFQIEGGPFGSPITWVSLGGTAVFGAALVGSARPMFRRVG